MSKLYYCNEVFDNCEVFRDSVDTRLLECKLSFSSMTEGVAYFRGSYYDCSGNEVKVLCTTFENYFSAQTFSSIETISNLMYSEQVRVWVDGNLLLAID